MTDACDTPIKRAKFPGDLRLFSFQTPGLGTFLFALHSLAGVGRKFLRATLIVTVLVATACTSVSPSSAQSEPALLVFSDGDLAHVLEKDALAGVGGLLYVWSPHMPYSVEGLSEVLELGERLELPVVPLLDPDADPRLAASVARKMRWSGDTLRAMRSNRLFQRGVTLHYPTLILFRRGLLIESILPGYVSYGVYEEFVRNGLGTGPS